MRKENLKQQIRQYYFNGANSSKLVTDYHKEIVRALEKTPVSVRQLEELTFHFFMSGEMFSLKQTISNIEHFLLLYNPSNKYDLCRYWQKLEEKGFDPTIEYNKAVEGFEMHYHPKTEHTFRIIIQISRFLKEFGDFETIFTPKFRHPGILGATSSINEEGKRISFKKDRTQSRSESSMMYRSVLNQSIDANSLKQAQLVEIGLLNELMTYNLYFNDDNQQQPQILDQIELLNIDIPSSKQKFRDYFIAQLNKNKIQINIEEMQQQQINQRILSREEMKETVSDIDVDTKEWKKNAKQKKEDSMEVVKTLNDQKITFYYYRRWLWIIFPLACQNLNYDYSEQMQLCSNQITTYMTVQQEQIFTSHALCIILQAKIKKSEILQNTGKELETQKKSLESIKAQLALLEAAEEENKDEREKANGKSMRQRQKEKILEKILEENKEPKRGKSQREVPKQRISKPAKRQKSVQVNPQENQQSQQQQYESMFLTEMLNQANQSKVSTLPPLNQSQTQDYLTNTSRYINKTKNNKFKYYQPQTALFQNKVASNQHSVLPRLKLQINDHTVLEVVLLEKQINSFKIEYNQLVAEKFVRFFVQILFQYFIGQAKIIINLKKKLN